MNKLCDYGCGQEAKYQFKNGKWCCENHRNKCPSLKQKNSKSQKLNQFRWSDEKKKEMSINRKGSNNPMFGKHHSDKTKKILSKRLKGKTYEDLYGSEKAEILKRNYSKKMKGRNAWNKDKTGIFNEESLTKIRNSSLGRKHLDQTKKKIAKSRLNKKHSIETKEKLSKISKKYWKDNYRKLTSNERKEKLRISLNKIYGIKYIKIKYPIFSKVEELRYNPDKPEEYEIQVRCKNHNCPNSKEQGGWFTPTRNQLLVRAWQLDKQEGNDGSYFYCCEDCKKECPLYNLRSDPNSSIEKNYTSEEYQTFRQEVLKRSNYKCEYCTNDATHVHHSRPQKLEPFHSLDPDFGIACCEKCHFKYGHQDECSTGQLANKVCNENII